MSGTSSVSFADEIRRTAAALGRTPTAQQVDDLETLVRSRTYLDEDAGSVAMNDGSDVAAFIAKEANAFSLVQAEPEPVAPDAWVKVSIGGSTGWRRASDPMATIMQSLAASDAAALAREIPSYSNPWLPGQVNRTHQVIISKSDPALAARFKSEAGIAE